MENAQSMQAALAPKDPLAPYKWALVEMQTHDTRELVGGQNNPRIIWYAAHTSLHATDDETPWCAAFLCTALEESGFLSPRSAAAKDFIPYGEEGTGAVGDIAVFSRAGGHHVAFINKPYRRGDQGINILGGNQGNKVCIENHRADTLIAIRRAV